MEELLKEVVFNGAKIRKNGQKTFELSVNVNSEKEEIAAVLDRIKKVIELWEE
jgi:hypothetical protein